jgi:hypothetical protein
MRIRPTRPIGAQTRSSAGYRIAPPRRRRACRCVSFGTSARSRKFPPRMRSLNRAQTRREPGGSEPLITQQPQRGSSATGPRPLRSPSPTATLSGGLAMRPRRDAIRPSATRREGDAHASVQNCTGPRVIPNVSSWAVAAHSCPNGNPSSAALCDARCHARPGRAFEQHACPPLRAISSRDPGPNTGRGHFGRRHGTGPDLRLP